MKSLTTASRLAHVILSERVCRNVSGKGREGNKEGKGREVVGLSFTSWRLVTYRAEPRDAMMALTREVSA